MHYQGLLPFRAGLLSPEAFLEDLNDTARRYYANPLNDTPDAEIAPRFWEDTRIRVLPTTGAASISRCWTAASAAPATASARSTTWCWR